MVKCQHEGCDKRASYGRDNEKPIRCTEHKIDIYGLTNTLKKLCSHDKQPRRCKICDGRDLCRADSCEKRANYGDEHGKHIWCYRHSRDLTASFIEEAKKVHKDKDNNNKPIYDYSKTIYISCHVDIIIICKIHGEFNQLPSNHLRNHGCKKCAISKTSKSQTMSQKEFIEKCEEKHPGLLDYTKTIYVNYNTPIIFICKLCYHEFQRDPGHMLGDNRGHGCTKCNGGVKDTQEDFIRKAREKHGDKYNYDLVEYVNSSQKVKIKCKKNNHIFEQAPNKHIQGDGCPYCKGLYKTTDDFIEQSIHKYGRDMFNYSKAMFKGFKEKLILICSNNHEFETSPMIHLRTNSKGGCIQCAILAIKLHNAYTTSKFIELAKIQHGELYNYDKVNYISSQNDVIINCPIHGDFEQPPACHLSGRGCKKCGFEKIRASKILLDAELKTKLIECSLAHDNKYEYIDIFRKDSRLFIEAICSAHGEFIQRLDHHLNGHACSKCTIGYSKQEIEWLLYLSVSDISIIHALNGGQFQIPNTLYSADGFSTVLNTIYEFHGDYWHGNPKVFRGDDINIKSGKTFNELYERTRRRTLLLKELGYNVVECWENEWFNGKKAIVYIQRMWRNRKKAIINDTEEVAHGGAGGVIPKRRKRPPIAED
jgi:hypothetical protein